MNIEYLKELLLISIVLSTITCAFIQKTKKYIKKSNFLIIYSFIVNMSVGIVFCKTFTKINFPQSLWIGLFSFIEADTIYKSLEGKLNSYKKLRSTEEIAINKENIINEEDK